MTGGSPISGNPQVAEFISQRLSRDVAGPAVGGRQIIRARSQKERCFLLVDWCIEICCVPTFYLGWRCPLFACFCLACFVHVVNLWCELCLNVPFESIWAFCEIGVRPHTNERHQHLLDSESVHHPILRDIPNISRLQATDCHCIGPVWFPPPQIEKMGQ